MELRDSEIEVFFFGPLAEIAGRDRAVVARVPDVASLRRRLETDHPGLVGRTYAIAVDREIADETRELAGARTVALLPPFSGG